MAKRSLTPSEYLNLKESSLGERIRFFREEVGKLSLKELYSTRAMSSRLGVSAPSITAIERGESKNPSFHLILGLAKELHLPIEVFTDDFYQDDINLFEIGTPDEENTMNPNKQIDPALSSEFYFGCYVYQVFQDGTMRFVYGKDAKKTVDYESFIESLSRFIAEIEVHSLNGGILKAIEANISPISHAASLFKACIEHPQAFPVFPKEAWNTFYNEFITKFEQKEKHQNEQT